jgi:hypothetical protein
VPQRPNQFPKEELNSSLGIPISKFLTNWFTFDSQLAIGVPMSNFFYLQGIQATCCFPECWKAVDDGAWEWLFATNWGAGHGEDSSGLFGEERLCSALPAGVLFLVLPRKSSQKEVAPTASPGYAGVSALLSRNGRAAELGALPLRQSSPFLPLRLALLDDAEGRLKTN